MTAATKLRLEIDRVRVVNRGRGKVARANGPQRQPDPCPPHNISKATEGPWVGRCVKCGQIPT